MQKTNSPFFDDMLRRRYVGVMAAELLEDCRRVATVWSPEMAVRPILVNPPLYTDYDTVKESKLVRE